MNIGLYSAYLGMRARQHTLDVIANNIANASTAGFKADHLFYHSVEAAELEAARRTAAAQANADSTPSTPNAAPTGQTNNQPSSQTSAQVSANTPADPLTNGTELKPQD